MAKATIKPKAPAKKAAKPKTQISILKVAEVALQKLEALNLDPKLQSEIQWCIGSYKHDQNPVGLLEKMTEALPIFKAEQEKKTKGITSKLVGDIEKVLAV